MCRSAASWRRSQDREDAHPDGRVTDPVLELEDVSRSFGSLRVIDGLSLRVERGEALGVVGPNGAGKTTMLNLVAGTLAVDEGRILFEGGDVTHLPPHARTRAGIGRTHQVPLPFEKLTLFENVLVGAAFGRGDGDVDMHPLVTDSLRRVGLAHKANDLSASLTLLERKRLELARALATGPTVLLLDEIAGGLTEAEVELLVETLLAIRAEGVTVVWIEHVVHALVSVIDRLLVIDFGRKLIEGRPDVVLASPEVHAVYLGVDE
jgi:branched-chain amino acid transport system ATP-binding protein